MALVWLGGGIALMLGKHLSNMARGTERVVCKTRMPTPGDLTAACDAVKVNPAHGQQGRR